MNELIYNKRENFRVQIRRQSLHNLFCQKRVLKQEMKKLISELDSEKEKKIHEQNSVEKSKQKDYDETIQEYLFQIFNQDDISIAFSIDLINKVLNNQDLREFFEDNKKYKTLLQSFLVKMQHKFSQSTEKQKYDQLLLTIIESDLLKLSDLKQSFTYCCKEFITQGITIDKALFISKMMKKFQNASEYFWKELNEYHITNQCAWSLILQFLRENQQQYDISKLLISMILLLMQIAKPKIYQKIVNDELIITLRQNLYANESQAIKSLECFNYIFLQGEREKRFLPLIIDAFLDLLLNNPYASYLISISILDCLELVSSDQNFGSSLLNNQELMNCLVSMLNDEIMQVNEVVLKFLVCYLGQCSDDFIIRIIGDSNFQNVVEDLTISLNNKVQIYAKKIKMIYFD
ncbi:unnamed protein product (macronuclear) [Paramecium tetraurelia]|uniref:IBB domain-containing protein n=1 Tax=Paramecium tetraurelia TaxID=5888 RepID=A0E116_PARTE|nr:uncharacterized protein GSPATT00022152001 [Paramecium tetraurelia]CAK88983.1 unnamed protein product [Paramecium tetraurelia]|eukprot:XP_001456380.1 hypothetical protein (macronuclear) [Paramecium tetraurelia strain d4-2]